MFKGDAEGGAPKRPSHSRTDDFATVIWPPLLSKFGPPVTLTDPYRFPRDLYLTYGVVVLMFVLTYLGGFLLIPSLNASIFSGSASTQFVNITRVRRLVS